MPDLIPRWTSDKGTCSGKIIYYFQYQIIISNIFFLHTSFRFPISFSKSNDSSFKTRRSNNSGRLNVAIYSFTTIKRILFDPKFFSLREKAIKPSCRARSRFTTSSVRSTMETKSPRWFLIFEMKYFFFFYFVVLNVHYKIVQFFWLLDHFDHLDFHQVYVKQMYFYKKAKVQCHYINYSHLLIKFINKNKKFSFRNRYNTSNSFINR